jgi:hypothetical protein
MKTPQKAKPENEEVCNFIFVLTSTGRMTAWQV